MSSESSRATGTRRAQTRRRRGRVFVRTFALVLGILVVVGAAGAAANVVQGPRVTDVQVDPDAAAQSSGARLIVTMSQSIAEVDESQVRVSPETPFAVDTSGRSVGVRFALPLWDDTEYTVTIDDVTSLGGGPTTDVSETFRTPAASVYLLQRAGDGSGDTIFRTGLSGENPEAVFTHPHIEDFRATSSHLVVSARTEDDEAALIMTDLDGQDARDLTLPGDGFVSDLQSADRGDLIGYTFSDADLSADGGLESALFTMSLKDPDAAPVPIEVDGADSSVDDWRFVPDTDSILLLSFDGSLLLTGSGGEGATALGTAMGIDGIARGSSRAIVERPDGRVAIDLTDASEEPLVEAEGGLSLVTTVTPLPDDSTIRSAAVLDGETPTGRTALDHVSADGSVRQLAEIADTDALLDVCVSPSARYVAVLIAPDAVDNPYDTYAMPLPGRVHTQVLEISDGAEVSSLAGSSISWCQLPPG